MKKKKKFLIITDSLGGPRFYSKGKIKYNKTWCALLKNYLESKYNFEVLIFNNYGMSTEELLTLTKNIYVLYDASYILIQVGIVDCAPRVLTRQERRFLSRLRIERFIRPVLSKYHAKLSKFRNITFISQEAFKRNLIEINNVFKVNNKNAKIFYIPILPPNKIYVSKSPLIDNNVNLYNQILKSLSDNINVYFLGNILENINTEEIYLDDNIHLNEKGHSLLFKKLVRHLEFIL